MTDNKIIDALRHHASCNCEGCPMFGNDYCATVLCTDAADCIEHMKTCATIADRDETIYEVKKIVCQMREKVGKTARCIWSRNGDCDSVPNILKEYADKLDAVIRVEEMPEDDSGEDETTDVVNITMSKEAAVALLRELRGEE